MFGLTFEKLLLIVLLASLLIGPERLPEYSGRLREAVRAFKGASQTAKSRVEKELELGDDFDWQALDPRRYHPRRIVMSALMEYESPPPAVEAAPVASNPYTGRPTAVQPQDQDRLK